MGRNIKDQKRNSDLDMEENKVLEQIVIIVDQNIDNHISSAMAATINSTPGWSMYYLPTFWIYGILVNPYYYPWNIPAVRRAVFCYAVNRTAALDSYNPIGITDDYLAPVSSIMIDTFPESIRSILFKCPYDPAKAAQILKSMGFYMKGGQWYTPNGTPLTLGNVYGPSGITNWIQMATTALTYLGKFGITGQLIAQDPGVFYRNHISWS